MRACPALPTDDFPHVLFGLRVELRMQLSAQVKREIQADGRHPMHVLFSYRGTDKLNIKNITSSTVESVLRPSSLSVSLFSAGSELLSLRSAVGTTP